MMRPLLRAIAGVLAAWVTTAALAVAMFLGHLVPAPLVWVAGVVVVVLVVREFVVAPARFAAGALR